MEHNFDNEPNTQTADSGELHARAILDGDPTGVVEAGNYQDSANHHAAAHVHETARNPETSEEREAHARALWDEDIAQEVVAEEVKRSRSHKKEKKGVLTSGAKQLIRDVAIACAIALLVSVFIRPTVVRETSMVPTVEPDDYLIMSKQAYTFGEPERGDIVIFRSDLKLDDTHNKLLIKRIIALPGDTIAIHDGKVYLNGAPLSEDYIAEGGTTGNLDDLTLGEGEIFVMGDHREVSVDSRSFGPIQEDDIVGQAVFRLYPFDKMGGL